MSFTALAGAARKRGGASLNLVRGKMPLAQYKEPGRCDRVLPGWCQTGWDLRRSRLQTPARSHPDPTRCLQPPRMFLMVVFSLPIPTGFEVGEQLP